MRRTDVLFLPAADLGNGFPWATPERMDTAWEIMRRHGLVEQTFYDGHVRDLADWRKFVDLRKLCMWLICRPDLETQCGVTWMSDRVGNTCQLHFCLFPEVWGEEAIYVGKHLLDLVFTCSDVQAIIGYTPKSNALARRYVRKLGFQELGCVPNGAHLAYDPRGVADLCISYCSQEVPHGRRRWR